MSALDQVVMGIEWGEQKRTKVEIVERESEIYTVWACGEVRTYKVEKLLQTSWLKVI